MRIFALLLAATALAGCGIPRMIHENGIANDPPRMREVFSDATAKTVSDEHGTQVEYFSREGRVYLWYPGNRRVVHGEWKVEPRENGGGRICFRYQANSYNPVTGEMGGLWECSGAGGYVLRVNELVAGDVFNLASGRPPFVMEPGVNLPISTLLERLGGSGEGLVDLLAPPKG